MDKRVYGIAKMTARKLRRNQTDAEKIMWEYLRNRRFCNKKFYRQYVIHFEHNGEKRFFVADFCCFEEKLIIEVDGEIHNRQKDYDELREIILNVIGYKVIRFKNEEILNSPLSPLSFEERGYKMK